MGRIVAPLTAEESAALIDACRSFIGVKFRHMGRKPHIGLDCAGMVCAGLTVIGREFKDIKAYGREPHKDGLRQVLIDNFGTPVLRGEMRAGDIPLMRFEGQPRHVGLLTNHPSGGLSLLHVHAHNKFVSEHSINDYWHGCIVAVWRP